MPWERHTSRSAGVASFSASQDNDSNCAAIPERSSDTHAHVSSDSVLGRGWRSRRWQAQGDKAQGDRAVDVGLHSIVGGACGSDVDPVVHNVEQSETSSEEKLPENLKKLLARKLDKITFAQNASSLENAPAAGELGAFMAMQGLFPRGKLASPQQLLLEHQLADGFARCLDGGARHLRGVFGDAKDLGLFEALRLELGRGLGPWSQGTGKTARIKYSIPGKNGMGLLNGECVEDLEGNELPAHSYVIRTLSETLGAEVLTWWTNIYEDSSVGLGFHHDNAGQNGADNKGLRWGRLFNMTVGASFGAERGLTFRHDKSRREFTFPQQNGDIFAFDQSVDAEFMHGIYQTEQDCGPRISVIMMGRTGS